MQRIAWLAHAAALVGCGSMLVAAGQPIFTDDLWWRLGLGRAFAAGGLALDEDPLLFAAAAPPSTAAWLFDVALARWSEWAGFAGLRALHVAWVAGLLVVAWRQLRRAGGSAPVASLGVLVFVACSAYRLVQLRPHLLAIALAFALFALLLERRGPPSAARIAGAAGLAALWANVHASFPLAPLLVASAAAGSSIGFALGRDVTARARALRLWAAAAATALATLANPQGWLAWRPYFIAGSETPTLAAVTDEWQGLAPFALPALGSLPTPLTWILVWALALGLLWLLVDFVRGDARARGEDPARLALALLGLALALLALRFVWLVHFALLALAPRLASAFAPRGRRAWLRPAAAAAAGFALVFGFWRAGDWPLVTRGLPTHWQGYQRDFPPSKYFTEAIWFLRDAGVEGNLYAEYTLGGFAGYWLAPRVRTLYNGSLNFERAAFDAIEPIRARRGAREGERFTELLDRLGVDLFLGVRTPEVGPATRPWLYTTTHLEGTPGWLPIFRSAQSALYLRRGSRAERSLERIAAYYDARGIPFDASRGFDVEAAIARNLPWSIEHALVPGDYARLAHLAQFGRARAAARERLASLHALLGLYARAVELDGDPQDASGPVRLRDRRRTWSLLRLEDWPAARRSAERLRAADPEDLLAHHLAEAAETLPGLDAELRASTLAQLPYLYRFEVGRARQGLRAPAPRPPRPVPREPSGEGSAEPERSGASAAVRDRIGHTRVACCAPR